MYKTIGKNAVLNIIKTISSIIFPLVTFPYASRVLHVDNLGKVNYSSSIISYFSLLASLGISVYAIREGAGIRNDKRRFERFVSEVYSVNIVTTIISCFILLLFILFDPYLHNYRAVLLILSMLIPFTTFSVDWINSIFEDYIYISIRTIVFQFIALLIIIFFVKKKDDYCIYALSTVVSSVGAGVLNYFYTKKYCKRRFTLQFNIQKHLKPIMILFATSIASVIYTSADTTMLGCMVGDYSVGLYSTAVKIYNIFKQVLFAIIVVSLPRLTFMYNNTSTEEYKSILMKVHDVLIILVFPIVIGLFMLSPEIIKILAGKEYAAAIPTLRILSISILFCTFGYFYMQLVLLPLKAENNILIATIISASVNIILNVYFIHKFKQNGCAFTTLLSELIVLLISMYCTLKNISIRINFKNIIQSFIGSILILIYIIFIKIEINQDILVIIAAFTGSVIIYGFFLILMKNDIIYDLLMKFRSKIHLIEKLS
ncbi:flippase [Clostridium oryzae]|uniref:Colanic acid exporter n=1 Tax=Clostridium oryzae TaxID=1450648 RepID=A0A1V4IRQ3_9CLOT|nr:flippase [Clostridium oryzae]OPJ62711.1 colanic acid exporter [Clostridium oryzae]